MFKIHGEPISPNEEACLRYMMNRNRQTMGGMFYMYDEQEPPNVACLS